MTITQENKDRAKEFTQLKFFLMEYIEKDLEEGNINEWKYNQLCEVIGWSKDHRPAFNPVVGEIVLPVAQDGDTPLPTTLVGFFRESVERNPIIHQQTQRTTMKTPLHDKQVSVAQQLREHTLFKCEKCGRNVKDLGLHQETMICQKINNVAKSCASKGTTQYLHDDLMASELTVGTIAERKRKMVKRFHMLRQIVREEKRNQETGEY